MATHFGTTTQLGTFIWPSFAHGTLLQRGLRASLLAFAGSLVIWLSAKIQIPLYPVPMTLHTLAVLSIGLVYGPRLGVATLLLYMFEGALGFPVFSGSPERGIGLAYMFGPTGGYLLGFVVAAGVVGWLAERGWDKRLSTTLAAMVIGNLAIYAFGLLWLGALIGWEKPLFQLGMFPFLLGDAVKIVIATLAFPSLWRLINRKS